MDGVAIMGYNSNENATLRGGFSFMVQYEGRVSYYCFVDDFLKGIGHYEPGNRRLSDNVLITTTIVSASLFWRPLRSCQKFHENQ